MLTERSAKVLNLSDYGFAVGRPADVAIFNAHSPEQAIAEISRPVAVFKKGKQTVRWHSPELLRPTVHDDASMPPIAKYFVSPI